MFPHEEYLLKALNECGSIHQLITDLVSLHTNRVNQNGTDEEFIRALHFEKAMDNFLKDWYERLTALASKSEDAQGNNDSQKGDC